MYDDNTPKQLNLFDVEIWRPVVGVEEYYAVSNHGRVMRTKASTSTKVGRILKPSLNMHGYLCVNISTPKRSVSTRIHKLVMEAFVGMRPDGMKDINHINGVKTDNRLENLEYCTRSENTKHAYKLGLRRVLKGTETNRAKLTQEQVNEIRNLYKPRVMTLKRLSFMYNISVNHVFMIVHNQTWKE